MPEQASLNALVPVDGEYSLTINEYDAAGKVVPFRIPVPSTLSTRDASVLLRAALLKRTTWKAHDFPTIIHAVMYADSMGLDIMAGDVYSAQGGRLSTTAGAKIRHAIASNRIEGYNVEISDGPAIKIPWRTEKASGTYEGPNLRAKVTVDVRGWARPVVYETTLAEWFVGGNPNWSSRPAYMLRRNALSKALEEVAPLGVEADEAPPLESSAAASGLSASAVADALNKAVQSAKQERVEALA